MGHMATKYTTTIMHGAHQFYVGCYRQPLLKIKIMTNRNPKTKTQEKEKKKTSCYRITLLATIFIIAMLILRGGQPHFKIDHYSQSTISIVAKIVPFKAKTFSNKKKKTLNSLPK